MKLSTLALCSAFAGAVTLVVLNVTPAFAQDNNPDSILGTWATPDGNLIINFYDAGETYAARFVYGAIIVEADGETLKQDAMNPDPMLRSRSLDEVDFLSGLAWDARDERWEGGTVYQAVTGNSASARAEMEEDALHLRAYRGAPLAGRTIVFQRWDN